jgi:RNA-binding protein Luc7-like 2
MSRLTRLLVQYLAIWRSGDFSFVVQTYLYTDYLSLSPLSPPLPAAAAAAARPMSRAEHFKALDSQRQLLDNLMGAERDVPYGLRRNVRITFSDACVCKHLLVCDECPHSLFSNTKSDLGPCRAEMCNAESRALLEARKEFRALDRAKRDEYGYEYDTWVYLRRLVGECDRRVARNKQRIRAEEEGLRPATLTEAEQDRLRQIQEASDKLSSEAQKLGDEGDSTKATEIMKRIAVLDQERQQIIAGPQVQVGASEKKLVVCEVSANYMSTTDNEERMSAHYAGKQYVGWKKLREKYKELSEMGLKPGTRRDGPSVASRAGGGGGGGGGGGYGAVYGGGGRGMRYGGGGGGYGGGGGGGGSRGGGRGRGRSSSSYGSSNYGSRYGGGGGGRGRGGQITGSNRDPIKNMRTFGPK